MKGNWTGLIVVLVIIVIILILALSGCASIGSNQVEAVEEKEPVVYPATWERLDRRSRLLGFKLTLEEHEYIVVSSSTYGEAGVTMIHSESCPGYHGE